METEHYRAYIWTLGLLKPIHQGVQATHCLGEIFLKESKSNGMTEEARGHLSAWINDHKTLIMLDGKNYANLQRIFLTISSKENTAYPWAHFCEDSDTLGGLMTSVGIILPESVYRPTLAFHCPYDVGPMDIEVPRPLSGYEASVYEAISTSILAS